MSVCEHIPLFLGVVNSVHFKYRQPIEQVRRKALTISTHIKKKRKINHARTEQSDAIPENWYDATTFNDNVFPAPIVVPGHDMALNPDYPPQPIQEWLEESGRNEVTPKRNIIVRVIIGRVTAVPA